MIIEFLVYLLWGLLGVTSIVAVIFALGCFEYLGGKKKSQIPPIRKETLKQKLLAINSPALPYEIKPGEETDLITEWKIVDAKWFSLFAINKLKKTYRAYLVLDEFRRAARYCEEELFVSWSVSIDGFPRPTVSASYTKKFFRGRILFQKSWNVEYKIKKDMTLEKVYERSFDIENIRGTIANTIEENGWEFVPVVNKKHATYKSIEIKGQPVKFGTRLSPTELFMVFAYELFDGHITEIEGTGTRGEMASQIFGEEEQPIDKIIIWNKIKELGLKDNDFNFIQESKGPFYSLCDFGTIKLYRVFDEKKGIKIRNILLSQKGGQTKKIKFREITGLPNAKEIRGFDTDLYRKVGDLDKKAEEIIREMRAGRTDEVMRKDVDINFKAIGWCNKI